MIDMTALARLRDSDMWRSFRHSPLVVVASAVALLYFPGVTRAVLPNAWGPAPVILSLSVNLGG